MTDPEIEAAEASGGYWHRSDLLAAVLRRRPCLGVTGSHGKGTVAALAAAALAEADLDPLAIIGVTVPDLGGMVRLGAGPIVAEVDDSDLTLGRVRTDVALVTNLDDDHPHLGNTLREAVQGVGEFVGAARSRVVIGPSPRGRELEGFAAAPVWRYGRDFSARTVSVSNGETRVELRGPDGIREQTVIRLIGPRTSVNAALAFAGAVALGADPEAAANGMTAVRTIRRRLEPVGSRNGLQVFDDFGGKHPLAVSRGIDALRNHFPHARITAVFEPYGPYLARWGNRYARALSRADRVVLVPPVFLADYPAGQTFGDGWIDKLTVTPVRARDRRSAVEAAVAASCPGDVLVFFAQVHASQAMSRWAAADGGPP